MHLPDKTRIWHMKKIITLLLLSFSTYLSGVKEKDLFPSRNEDVFQMTAWWNADQHLCLLSGSHLIIVDQWHFAIIDDNELN